MIRVGEEADIIKVSRLWLEMIKEMRPDFTPNVEWWRKLAEANFRSRVYCFLVNDDGGKITGFVDWFFFPEPSTGKFHAVGQHLYLVPEMRNTGIGRSLYESACYLAGRQGATVIELMCFNEELPLWEKKGFKPLRHLVRREVQNV